MGTRRAAAERLALGGAGHCSSIRLTYFLPVAIEHDEWGRPWADPRPPNGSGDFLSLAGTDGFVELPPGPNTYPEGIRHQHVPLVTEQPMQTPTFTTSKARESARPARPAAARSAHLGDGPLQLPLPLLHAQGDSSTSTIGS